MSPPTYTRADLSHSPMIVFYETTRACDLMCLHCRADAQKLCHPKELSTDTATKLFDQLATFPKPPLLVLTGGDPLKRPDVFTLVNRAVAAGLQVAMTPSATPLVTRDAIQRLKDAGLHRLAVSLDGPDPDTHDNFRRVRGSFAKTLQIIRDAREVGLPIQINTTVAKHNRHQLDQIADLLTDFDISLWSVFFLVPTGRASVDQRLSAQECEDVFAALYRQAKRQPYAIKTTEAPHYRRYVLQQAKEEARAARASNTPSPCPLPEGEGKDAIRLPLSASSRAGVKDGCGVLFISHTGEISPSGFLPIPCGQFPTDSVTRTYQEHPAFLSLRDPDQLQGKCGRCEYKTICGGSRARAQALFGNPLAEEPDCIYQPPPLHTKRPS